MNFLEKLKSSQSFNQISVSGSSGMEGVKDIDLYSFPFLKAGSEFYQKFDVVWHYSKSFGKDNNWRTILDEMVRMIGKEGYIVLSVEAQGDVKVCQDYQRILANVKMYLFRKVGLKCNVEYEDPKIYQYHAKNQSLEIGNRVVVVINIIRENLKIYQDKSWTFAMITGGNKVNNVVNFCRSIRDLDQDFKHEILICGPQDKAYEQFQVKYLDHTKYRDEYAEICKKKNDLAMDASNQNLMISHDRFTLEKDFFDGFEKYGYDFDFIAPRIVDKNNVEEDCWFVLGKNIFDKDILRFGDFFDAFSAFVLKDHSLIKDRDISYSFLSGGCLIFKRDILRQFKFNELIFWHQIEDWEISANLINNGVLPQLNRFSSVLNSRVIDFSSPPYKKGLAYRLRKSLAKRFMKIAFKIINQGR